MISLDSILNWLLGGALFIITLGVLVFVHELGHFLAAKSVGVAVEEFAIGFGPKVVTWLRRGGTDYTIRWLPLGGFVSMVGMQPEDVAVPNGLMSKPAWARGWVFVAGPLMNLILGILVFCTMGVITGIPEERSTQVWKVVPGSEAAAVGLRTGDRVLAVDGVHMTDGKQLIKAIQDRPGQSITLTVQRDGETLRFTARPTPQKEDGKTVGKLGFYMGVTFKRLGFHQSVREGIRLTGDFFVALYDIARRGLLKDSAGGPVAMLSQTKDNASLGHAGYQYGLVGQLSLSLTVFNLLPIPVLDGGHLAILLVEVIRRRRLGAEAHRVATAMGLVVIGMLFVFLTYSDIAKWITGKL